MGIYVNAYIEYNRKIWQILREKREIKEKGLTSKKKPDTIIPSLEEILYGKR